MVFFQKSFAKRIVFYFVVTFLIVFIGVGFFVSRRLEDQVLSNLKNSLASEAILFGNLLNEKMSKNESRRNIHHIVRKLGLGRDTRITVMDIEGTVFADSKRNWDELLAMGNHRHRPEIAEAYNGRMGSSTRFSRTLKTNMHYVAVPIKVNEEIIGVVRAALPLTQVQSVLMAAQRPLIVATVVGALLVLFVGFIVGNSMTRRIAHITRAAIRYSRGDLSRKVHMDTRDELRILADTMNKMALGLKLRITESSEERAKAAAILENLGEGVIAVNENRVVLMTNSSVESILGVSQSNMLGRSLIESVRNHHIDQMIEKAVREKINFSEEIEITHPTRRALKVNAVSMDRELSEIAGIVVLYDVTKIRRLESMRRDFVANVSHELKTPLTSIKGFIETLLAGAVNDPGKSKKFLGMMESDAARLARLIQDLLNLSRIESKEFELNLTAVSLSDVVDRIVEPLKSRMEDNKISFTNKIEKGKQPSINADVDQLEQVFINLIDNAVKFSREGGTITVSSEVVQGKYLQVNVEDDGAGIPEKSLPRVFERFYTVDKARSRELGGTGLGLSIVKHIIESHGGQVGCTSVTGQGSIFFFTLPIQQ